MNGLSLTGLVIPENPMATAPGIESAIPLVPCSDLSDKLEFYDAPGFEVLFQQEDPYL